MQQVGARIGPIRAQRRSRREITTETGPLQTERAADNFRFAQKLVFVGNESRRFQARHVNHLRAELKKGYWAAGEPEQKRFYMTRSYSKLPWKQRCKSPIPLRASILVNDTRSYTGITVG
jgi:hypothetical protein